MKAEFNKSSAEVNYSNNEAVNPAPADSYYRTAWDSGSDSIKIDLSFWKNDNWRRSLRLIFPETKGYLYQIDYFAELFGTVATLENAEGHIFVDSNKYPINGFGKVIEDALEQANWSKILLELQTEVRSEIYTTLNNFISERKSSMLNEAIILGKSPSEIINCNNELNKLENFLYSEVYTLIDKRFEKHSKIINDWKLLKKYNEVKLGDDFFSQMLQIHLTLENCLELLYLACLVRGLFIQVESGFESFIKTGDSMFVSQSVDIMIKYFGANYTDLDWDIWEPIGDSVFRDKGITQDNILNQACVLLTKCIINRNSLYKETKDLSIPDRLLESIKIFEKTYPFIRYEDSSLTNPLIAGIIILCMNMSHVMTLINHAGKPFRSKLDFSSEFVDYEGMVLKINHEFVRYILKYYVSTPDGEYITEKHLAIMRYLDNMRLHDDLHGYTPTQMGIYIKLYRDFEYMFSPGFKAIVERSTDLVRLIQNSKLAGYYLELYNWNTEDFVYQLMNIRDYTAMLTGGWK